MLVVFDTRSETDPFAGVRHWERAQRQARRVQGDSPLPLKKFLVAARADRGGIGTQQRDVETLRVGEPGFDHCFETSAKEGWNMATLANAIREGIDWQVMPRVSSPILFQHIKTSSSTRKRRVDYYPQQTTCFALF